MSSHRELLSLKWVATGKSFLVLIENRWLMVCCFSYVLPFYSFLNYNGSLERLCLPWRGTLGLKICYFLYFISFLHSFYFKNS
jgi:hypothetical protein